MIVARAVLLASGAAMFRTVRYRRIEKAAVNLLGALDRQNTNLVTSLNVREAQEELRLRLRGVSTR